MRTYRRLHGSGDERRCEFALIWLFSSFFKTKEWARQTVYILWFTDVINDNFHTIKINIRLPQIERQSER